MFKHKRVLITGILLFAFVLGLSGIRLEDRKSAELISFGVGNEKVITLGHSADAAGAVDYVFDGTDDNVQLQAALNALPATGGRLVIVSAVELNLAAAVTRAIDNVTIEGTGRGTYITRDAVNPVFTAGGNNWVFSNLRTDAGGLTMGATTGWVWQNVTINVTHYTLWENDGQIGTGTAYIDTLNAPTGRTATYVVAASDAPTIWQSQSDVIVAGDANAEIIAAIATGSDILLSPGTFTVSMDQFAITTAGQKLCGSGEGLTTLLLNSDGAKLFNIQEANVIVSDFTIDGDGHTVQDVFYLGAANKDSISIHHITALDMIVTTSKGIITASTGKYHYIGYITANNCVTGTADSPCSVIKIAGATNTFVEKVRGVNSGHIEIGNNSTFIWLSDCDIDLDDDCHGGYYVDDTATDIFINACSGTVLHDKGHAAFELRGNRITATDIKATLNTGDDGVQIQTINNVDVTSVTINGLTVNGGSYPVSFQDLGGTGLIVNPIITGLQATGYSNTTGQAIGDESAGALVTKRLVNNPAYVDKTEYSADFTTLLTNLGTPIIAPTMWERNGNISGNTRYGFNLSPRIADAGSATKDYDTPPYYLNRMTMARFNGTDEFLQQSDQAPYTRDDTGGAGPFTMVFAVKLTSSAAVETLVSKWDETGGAETREYRITKTAADKINVEIYDETNNVQCSRLTDAAVTTGSPIILGINYTGSGGATAANNIAIYVNGAVVASTATNDGSYVGMRDTTAYFYIGTYENAAGALDGFYSGQMGWMAFSTTNSSNIVHYIIYQILKGVMGV